ncbi:MAG: hypothetical protein KTR25_19590 [Myxococcales bacterium]|nr:hypothetical protein [Myxococcales bacterium]
MFTDREIELVRTTWAPVSEQPDVAASLFYTRLFEVAPEVKPMFKTDITAQGKKLMQMINIAVENMHKVEQIVPALQELGKRHRSYGTEDGHYEVVGAVLIDTLAAALGDDFTPDAAAAWKKTYGALASVMIGAK